MIRKNEAHDAVMESLTQALLLLMEQKPLAQINISELCEKAGVSRVSFYRNFDSMEQILLQHFIRCTDDWWADFKKKDSAAMSESFWSELLEQYRKNKRLVQLLYENGVSHIIKEHIFACCAPDSAPDEIEGYARAMLAGTLYGLIDEWIRRGMKELPPDFSIRSVIARYAAQEAEE